MKYQFNLSQSHIWNNEIAFPATPINSITSKLLVETYSLDQIKEAVETVLVNADIFSMELVREGAKGYLRKVEDPSYHCTIVPFVAEESLDEYIEAKGQLPFEEGCLYQVELIPVYEGKVMVFSRFHHLIMDGYSMSLYGQYVLDALAGKQIVESCFAEDMNGYTMTEQEFEQNKEMWTDYFRGAECSHEIYGAVSEGMSRTEYRENCNQKVEKEIKKYAEAHEIRMPYIYLAAYAIYLARATGKKDAMIFMSRLGRTREQMHKLGCYVLTVPVRIAIEDTDTFPMVCEKALISSKKAAAGKWFGFDNIQKIAKEEGVETASLTANVYSYFRHTMNSHDIPFRYELTGSAMNNDLTFNVMAFDEKTTIELELANKVYDVKKGQAFIQSITKILEQGMQEKLIGEMEIVSDVDKQRLMSVQGADVALHEEDTIVSLLEKAVKKYGERDAVFAGENGLTFTQLDEWSSKIAEALVSRGVQKGDSVCFMLHRDIRLIPTIFGILKAGAVFVPIDVKYPTERKEYIIQDSGCRYIISAQEVEPEVENWIDIDELLKGNKVDEDILGQREISCEDAAYMIYTSGTTGTPKGVRIAHKGIVNIVQPDNNPFNKEITQNGKGLVAVGSISFDISLFEIFVPLLNGLFVEMAPEDALVNPSRLTEVISAHGADVMHCTPSRLSSYLKLPAFQEVFKGMKAILSAGEELKGYLVNEIRSNYGVKIYNGYGPTEITIGATITEAFDDKTIGKPIGNMGILILDNKGRALPYGAVGQICVYGVGLGIGYHNLPELTQKKYCEYEGKRIYCTGDLGYLNEQGQLMYRGRMDRQVKLRGLRIELDEIEHGILSFEGTQSTVCLVRKIGNQQHLVAFYETKQGATVCENDMKATLQTKLPYYMVPELFVELEAIPQTISGKVDMRVLESYPLELNKVYVEPTNPTEVTLCETFLQVLSLNPETEKVGIEDSFFDLGGDSLQAAILMLALEEKMGEGCIRVSDIYKLITPKNMAKFISSSVDKKAHNSLENLDYSGFDDILKAPEILVDEKCASGNVLVTGVTGYLGVHILVDLLKRPDLYKKIYCIARNKGKLTAKKRVLGTLFYYADDNFLEEYGSRWEVVEGDITQPETLESLNDISFSTVIHSAANVSHFGKQEELDKTNVESVKNLIRFCKQKDACLCQVSTISISGSVSTENDIGKFTEEKFFIGQEIHNQYIASKYMSEYAMLRAAVDEGTKVKIIRVGNLQGRIQDGEFQMNLKSNAFTRRITSYMKIGAIPESVYNSMVNFSPVDDTAHMLVTIAATANKQIAYNLYPPMEIAFKRIADILAQLEYPLEVLSDEMFSKRMNEMRETESGQQIVADILIEKFNLGDRMVEVDQGFTQKILEAHHEAWGEISDEYLVKCFTGIAEMIFF